MRLLLTLLVAATAGTLSAQERDPTRPPSQAEIEAWFGTGPQVRGSAPFRLQSILLSPTRRIAVIDDQRLRIGEHIGTARVTSIEPGRVVLEQDDKNIVLEIATHLDTENDPSRD